MSYLNIRYKIALSIEIEYKPSDFKSSYFFKKVSEILILLNSIYLKHCFNIKAI